MHETVFGWVLALVAERGLVKGERIGVDASTMEANAALRTIVRRDTGETYREMLTRMAQESGIETPTAEDLSGWIGNRKGKKLSNADWASPTDPGREDRQDEGRHDASRPTSPSTRSISTPASSWRRRSTRPTRATRRRCRARWRRRQKNLAAVGLAPTAEDPCELVADKGYHSRAVLKDLDGGAWKTRIAEPQPATAFCAGTATTTARAAVYANRNRLRSGVGKEAMRKRAEMVERSFAHILDRGGMRRTWLRGRENVHKRYLIHVAGYNLGILMRLLIGAGTPKERAAPKTRFCSSFRPTKPSFWPSPPCSTPRRR